MFTYLPGCHVHTCYQPWPRHRRSGQQSHCFLSAHRRSCPMIPPSPRLPETSTPSSKTAWTGGNCSVGRASNWKARHNNDAGLSPWCSDGFFSQGRPQVQTLLWCLFNPRVQLHASTSVCRVKIPNTGSHTIVWTHEMWHTCTDRNG